MIENKCYLTESKIFVFQVLRLLLCFDSNMFLDIWRLFCAILNFSNRICKTRGPNTRVSWGPPRLSRALHAKLIFSVTILVRSQTVCFESWINSIHFVQLPFPIIIRQVTYSVSTIGKLYTCLAKLAH